MCKIGAIILAAGLSRRMGKPKLLLPFLNLPLIHFPVALTVAQKFHPIIIVGGKYTRQLQLELNEYKDQVAIIYNSGYEKGMSTSLKVGMNALEDNIDATFIFLGDQPFVSNDVVEKIIQVYKDNKNKGIKIVRPRYANHPGHPILFDKSLFSDFQTLSGDEGGKSIIQANYEKLIYVDFESTKSNFDVDTPDDYDNLIKENPS